MERPPVHLDWTIWWNPAYRSGLVLVKFPSLPLSLIWFGAAFGLTCSRYQSGEIDWSGRISRCGDEMMRVMLYEAAQSMIHSKKFLAQGLGHADRQTPRDEESDRGPATPAGRDHAPHLGWRHRVPVDRGASRGSSMKTVQD
jgi:hypothetical protein